MLFQSQIDQSVVDQSHIDRQFQQQFYFRMEDIHHDDGEQTETKTIENEIKIFDEKMKLMRMIVHKYNN